MDNEYKNYKADRVLKLLFRAFNFCKIFIYIFWIVNPIS